MSIPEVFRRSRFGSELIGDLSFLIREPADVYHFKANEYLSSHQLADFRRCAEHYHKKQTGLIQDTDRPAYFIGRATHTLILEGREPYEREYAVGGPINPKTGKPYGSRTLKFTQWAEAQGRPVLSEDQASLIEAMNMSVHGHKKASDLISRGVAEGVIRTDYCGVPSQSRIDWINPGKGIVDLKTCENLDWLQMDAKSYGYLHQLAFYRAMVALVTDIVLPVYLIAVEKREPNRCGVWRMGEDVLAIAQRDNEEAIERLKQCRVQDYWPSGYEEIRVFDSI